MLQLSLNASSSGRQHVAGAEAIPQPICMEMQANACSTSFLACGSSRVTACCYHRRNNAKPSMNLRAANTEDLALLFAIHRSVFRSHIETIWGWDEDWQLQNFASECATAATCVIEVDDRIAGYLQVLDRGSPIYVQNIAIAPAFQGKGVGTMILKGLQSKAAARKLPIHLGVFRTNTPAQRLYERLGFRKIGETPTHIQMAWDDLHLARDGAQA